MSTINRIIRISLLTFLLAVGFLLIVFGITDSYVTFKYSEDNSINYKVYLKPNNYFDTPYLGENRTYITSIIDYIHINYIYSLNFSEKISGDYTYRIEAVVYANKSGGDGYYWTKTYNLTEPKKVKLDNKDHLLINEIVDVDYNQYNKVLEDFKKDYSIETDGLLKIQLIVESNATGDKYTDNIKIPSNLSLSVPLLEKAVEASIEKNAVSNDNTLTMIDSVAKYIKSICFVLGLLIIALTIFLIIRIFINRSLNRRKHLYESTLKKFVDSHDSIIANVTNLPDITDLSLIHVSSFDELIDVYNEVRMPINFYENSNHTKAVFIIINDRMCWEYVLDKREMEKKNYK